MRQSSNDLFESLFNIYQDPTVKGIYRDLFVNPYSELRYDAYTTEDGAVILVDVPAGCQSPTVKVEKGVLSIELNRPHPEVEDSWKKISTERRFGTWKKTWDLADTYDPESVDAELKNGELKVTIKFAAKKASKVVEVRT